MNRFAALVSRRFWILINSTPQPMFAAIDRDDNFIQVPLVARASCATAYLVGISATELFRPFSHGLMRDDDAFVCQHVFNHAKA